MEKDEEIGLVKITFADGQNVTVERDVYPEVAKFVTSRREAAAEHTVTQRRIQRERQRYLWEKEDEWYADPARPQNTFNEYITGRQWDREQAQTNGETLFSAENKYNDFMMGSRRGPSHRSNRDNPNSWEILRDEARAAGHKEVAWIVDNCLDNEQEAGILVKYLPATIEELWSIAKDNHDMCGVFDRYMERAVNAGVLNDAELPSALRETRALHSYIRRIYGAGYIQDLMARVKPIVKAEVEAAVAKARAEWQGLDEAYAENVHRNRSEGARRAAETRRRNREAEAKQAAEATLDRVLADREEMVDA